MAGFPNAGPIPFGPGAAPPPDRQKTRFEGQAVNLAAVARGESVSGILTHC